MSAVIAPADGFDIIQSMKISLAVEYIGDELYERHHQDQTFLEAMTDHVLMGDYAEAGRVFRECLISAGESVLERDINLSAGFGRQAGERGET